ncbi:vWA domain-containing protein [Lentzea sp. JNUCC 0626]|uniref:vWA domain-containing protein n=1 Tax=Lentzea sp. JNUCC 0626 TaxID=3367513 RepID=UPI00374A8750
MKTAYRTRCWADLTARRPDRSPVEGSFGRRYLAALLGTPTLAPPVEQTQPARQRSFFGPLLAAASIVAVVTLAVWVVTPGPPSLNTVAVESVEVHTSRIVIALDESASMTPEDLAHERQAAEFVVRSQLSPRSSVAVLGFSDDAQVLCPMRTLAGKAERDAMSDCIKNLENRRPNGGTNHVAAMREALSQFVGTEPGDRRMIFLLTDGRLDVDTDPEADRALKEETSKARNGNVQIWPIGFGPEVDREALSELAAGGYPGSCDDVLRRPGALTVWTSAGLIAGLAQSTADAQCAGVASVQNLQDRDVQFTVRVPEGAKAAAIVLLKDAADVNVRLFDSENRPVPKSGRFGEITVETDGERDLVEVIRLTGENPGGWRVIVDSPGRAVTVFATWAS